MEANSAWIMDDDGCDVAGIAVTAAVGGDVEKGRLVSATKLVFGVGGCVFESCGRRRTLSRADPAALPGALSRFEEFAYLLIMERPTILLFFRSVLPASEAGMFDSEATAIRIFMSWFP